MKAITQPTSDEKKPQRWGWKRAFKVFIAVLVIAALVQATAQAIRKLREQDAAIQSKIHELEQAQASGDAASAEAAASQVEALRRSRLTVQTIHWPRVAAGMGLYLIGMLGSAWYWWRILIAFGYRPTVAPTMAAHIAGHLGKYVPGKALVVILRAAGVSHQGIPFGAAALAAIMETLTYMAAGAAAASLATLFLDAPRQIRLLAIGLTLLTLAPTLPPFFCPVVNFLLRRRGGGQRLDPHQYTWRLTAEGWLAQGFAWLGTGSAFWFILRSLPAAADGPWDFSDGMLATGAIALAVVAGFASLLPGGAGVREWVLVTLLQPRFGLPTALTAAIVARMAFLVAELAAYAMSRMCLGTRPARSDQTDSSNTVAQAELTHGTKDATPDS